VTVRLHVDGALPLLLRPWSDADVAQLVEAYDDPVMRRWSNRLIDNEADAKEWLDFQQRGWQDGTRFCFAVLEADGLLLGNVVLHGVDPDKATAEVGYWTGARARGRGVAPAALEAITGWAFDTFEHLDALELLHDSGNQASCRVAEKTGYRLDSVIPPRPPFPNEDHRHVRRRSTPGTGAALRRLCSAVAGKARMRQATRPREAVMTAQSPFAAFDQQRTIRLTSYKRDGTGVGTAVNIAVEGDHAFVRTYDKAWKAKRMRNNPGVEIAPSTFQGKATGPAMRATARLLSGAEAENAAKALAAKHRILHGILVPFFHRRKKYQTLHYELTANAG
jgi:PPOX class probable F420-dependent enzyme